MKKLHQRIQISKQKLKNCFVKNSELVQKDLIKKKFQNFVKMPGHSSKKLVRISDIILHLKNVKTKDFDNFGSLKFTKTKGTHCFGY